MTGLAYPDISPIVFSIGSFAIRWYSLAYLFGIILAWLLISKNIKKYNLPISKTNLEDLVFYVALGIILGGRLGYVIFYGTDIFLKQPLEIFALWHGGMSFHGGIIGVIVAIYLASKKLKYSFLGLTDLVSLYAPIGIFLGRIANFINDELWGRVANVPWAVRFPNGGYLPRHPSQIYEALTEGVLILIILNVLWQKKWVRENNGYVSGVFLLLYGVFRVFMEQFREPDAHIGFVFVNITMGQLLSAPFICVGCYLIIKALQNKKRFKQ